MKKTIENKNLILVYRAQDDDDNQDLVKPLDWKLMGRLFTYAKPVRGKLRRLILFTIIRSAQLPFLAWLAARIMTGPIAAGNIPRIFLGVAEYLGLAITTDGLFHFRQRYALEIGETVVKGVREDVFRRVMSQPMSFFHRMKLGRIISRVTSDVEAVRVGIQDVAFVSAIQAGQMVVAAALMLYYDWHMFLVVAAMAPVLWMVNNHFRMKFSRLTRASQDSFSRVTATLAESVNGIRVTQGFVRQETNAGLFRSLLADHSRYNVAVARTSAILAPLLELNSQFFVAVLLVFGGSRVLGHHMGMQQLVMFFLMANLFFSPITIIGNQYNQALIAMASAERIFWLLDIEPDWQDDPKAQDLPRSGGGVARGARVEFRKLCFGYVPGRLVLHDIDFTAEPGQSVALVGHTGSGKSSIINLVAKFYLPSAGELRIDGREIRDITSLSLHRQMGMVQQQNFLFSGTVLENIRLSRPEASVEEVAETARRLDCLDIIEGLPRGLHTEVGERGAGLSVGERQLICFCRALLADPRIVILDEATSSIDALTENRLQKALIALLQGRTSFIVAHRLSTIRHADLVLVLDQGHVVERGTHAALLAQGGHYAALHRQFVQMDDRKTRLGISK